MFFFFFFFTSLYENIYDTFPFRGSWMFVISSVLKKIYCAFKSFVVTDENIYSFDTSLFLTFISVLLMTTMK